MILVEPAYIMGHMFHSFLLLLLLPIIRSAQINPNGYLAYCPCMGRFGNQADHLLGAMAFTKALNRTFLIPPWVEYEPGNPRSVQTPYKTYFDPEGIQEYQDAMTMEDFMETLAPEVWPPHARRSFCFNSRSFSSNAKPNDCNAKEGNPFGPFWDTFDIDFVGSEFWQGLDLNIQGGSYAVEQWNLRFPPDKFPVLAFTGAPAHFPVRAGHKHLQKYVRWSKEMIQERDSYVMEHLGKGDYISVHLRNGMDWVRACEIIKEAPQLFAAAQCLGYNNEFGNPTPELCNPSVATIMKHVRRALQKTGAKYLYVASDDNRRVREFKREFQNVTVVWNKAATPHQDLILMAHAKHFIGNCISSFTAFVKRERDVRKLPSSFFGFPVKQSKKKDEL